MPDEKVDITEKTVLTDEDITLIVAELKDARAAIKAAGERINTQAAVIKELEVDVRTERTRLKSLRWQITAIAGLMRDASVNVPMDAEGHQLIDSAIDLLPPWAIDAASSAEETLDYIE